MANSVKFRNSFLLHLILKDWHQDRVIQGILLLKYLVNQNILVTLGSLKINLPRVDCFVKYLPLCEEGRIFLQKRQVKAIKSTFMKNVFSDTVCLNYKFFLLSVAAEDTEDGDSFRRPTSMGPVKLPNSAVRISRYLIRISK